MARTQHTSRRGFSLIELVIVVVIIGIIAAIAIPRMSRGTAGAADSAVSGNLNVLRNAVELYATEHGGKFPDRRRSTTSSPSTPTTPAPPRRPRPRRHIYGPYLRKIPPVTVGGLKNKAEANVIATGATDTTTGATGGWWYNTATGAIRPNTVSTEVDQGGKPYSEY